MSAFDSPTLAEVERDEEAPHHCRCKHDTSNPELGCTCGYADWLCDEGLS